MLAPGKILLGMLLLTTALHAQEGGDVQAQILYAYHTEDTNSLTDLIQMLSAKLKDAPGVATPGDDAPGVAALRYHLAHAQYRFGELSAAGMSHRAESAYSECIDDLKPLLQKDVKSVEGLVLQGACYGALANLSSVQALLLRARAADRLRAAAKLAPHNPRLLLIEATQGLQWSKPDSPELARASAQLNMAVEEFDASSATSIDVPGWGHAQAYLAMGRARLALGDTLGARNWIEKALIAAPDYKAAQRQLASLEKH
jgi:tetratricopeptide (TPR) repeat protein